MFVGGALREAPPFFCANSQLIANFVDMNLPNLNSEIVFKTSRSGGKGGQHVNKVSTKVELNFDIAASLLLNEDQKRVLLEKLNTKLTSTGLVQVIAQSERSQLGNKKVALDKFYLLLEKCFAVRKIRKPTKATKASKERRLKSKKHASEIKRLRSGI